MLLLDALVILLAIGCAAGAPTTIPGPGRILAWGDDTYGQRTVPDNAQSGVVAIAAGLFHSLALLDSGRIMAWGGNAFAQSAVPANAQSGGVAISAGGFHSLALLDSGRVLAWGKNEYNETTVPDDAQSGVVAIAAGGYHSLALLDSGRVVAWGHDVYKQSSVPRDAQSGVAAIAAGGFHSLALLDSGRVLAWGYNEYNQTAVRDDAQSGVVAIAAGAAHSLALLDSGRVVAWGDNAYNQTTVPDDAQSGVKAIAAGDYHSLALLHNGRVVAWGYDIRNQSSVPSDAQVGIVAVVGGGNHSLALSVNPAPPPQPPSPPPPPPPSPPPPGAEYAGEGTRVATPGLVVQWGSALQSVPVSARSSVVAVAAGQDFSLAMLSDGGVQAWGNNTYNQSAVPSSSGMLAVSADGWHSLGLLANGRVVAWGYNEYNQTAVPDDAQSGVVAIAAGGYHSLALLDSGRVLTWGDNLLNQTAVPEDAQSGVTAISAGGFHSLALLDSGRVVAWGDSNRNQTAVPEDAQSGVTAISAGGYHSLALLDSGRVVAWGSNAANQSSVPSEAQARVVAIAAGVSHSLALLDSGRVVAWGRNDYNQSSVPSEAQAGVVAIAAGWRHSLAIVSAAPLPPSPSPPPASLIPVSEPKQSNPALVAGIAAGGGSALVLGIMAWWYWRQRKLQLLPMELIDDCLPGLTKGEVFTRATAHEYTWVDSGPANPEPAPEEETHPVQLTRAELKRQVQMVSDGLLGRGATALVFKCMWPQRYGARTVLAAKVLKDGFELDPQVLQSFSYEATVLASLNPPHPNVVRLYGYCLEPPTVCLILELLPASLKTLLYPAQAVAKPLTTNYVPTKHILSECENSSSDMCTATGGTTTVTTGARPSSITSNAPSTFGTVPRASALSMADVLRISLDIAQGLRYLHDKPLLPNGCDLLPTGLSEVLEDMEEGTTDASAGGASQRRVHMIVHRDMKPANVLIDHAGRAKISDFGLARQQQQSTMMTEHVAAGTLPYMAPELLVTACLGSADMQPTNRVDIYAFGMIMWEMLAGRPPWSHMNEAAIVGAVLAGRRPELPMDEAGAEHELGDQQRQSLSEVPASLHALPQLNAIIRACWQQREHRRPTAAAVCDMLQRLVREHDGTQERALTQDD